MTNDKILNILWELKPESKNEFMQFGLQLLSGQKAIPSLKFRIFDTVLQYFHISSDEIFASRRGKIPEAKQIIAYLCYELINPKISDKEIGYMLNQDRSTVYIHRKKVETLIESEKGYGEMIKEIKNKLLDI